MTNSKFQPGMVFANEQGFRLEVLAVRGSIHKNTSKVTIRATGYANIGRPVEYDGERAERTDHVSNMIRNFNLVRV